MTIDGDTQNTEQDTIISLRLGKEKIKQERRKRISKLFHLIKHVMDDLIEKRTIHLVDSF